MWPARHEQLNTRIRVCPPLNFDPVYTVHGQSSILLAYSVLCSYECTYLYRECVGITSPPVGTALLHRRKRKQISKLVRFIMNTARLSNVIVTDFKFTSFSSGEESSPHNTTTSALETERFIGPNCPGISGTVTDFFGPSRIPDSFIIIVPEMEERRAI